METTRRAAGRLLKGVLGRSRYTALREAWYCYHETRARHAELDFVDEQRFKRMASNYDDPRLVESRNRIAAYRWRHAGRRCFIIGNGPSLNRTDLGFLKNEITFGANRIYLMRERNGFLPTYYVVANPHVIRQFTDDIRRLPMPKFLTFLGSEFIGLDSETMFFDRPMDGTLGFSLDVPRGVWTGSTVTYCMMQIAYYMGFKQVILIGVDHNFQTHGKPHKLIVSKNDDPDHFDPRYFGKGIEWQLPDLEGSELAYRLAKMVFEGTEREIVDATIGGKLEVFGKVDYASLF